MRIRLTPQRREFFELLASASSKAVDIARLLLELLNRFPEDGAELVGRIKTLEHRGGRREVAGLNRTFVTPFDRDDIYRLAGARRRMRPLTTPPTISTLQCNGSAPRARPGSASRELPSSSTRRQAPDGFNDSTL
jgi:hypothetical protein